MAFTDWSASPETLHGIEFLHWVYDSPLIAFDTETTGLKPKTGGLRLLQLAAPGKPVVVIDLWDLDEEQWDQVREFFTAVEDRDWYAHNATFDLAWLQQHEIYPEGMVFCTMLASRLLENGIPNVRNGLAPACKRYLKVDVSKEEQASDWSKPDLSESQKTYAANDVRILLHLAQKVTDLLFARRLFTAWRIECRALQAIAHMQLTGLPFNRAKLEELQKHYEGEIERLGAEFLENLDAAMPDVEKLPRDDDGTFNLRAKATGHVRLGTKKLAGFNLNSPKQLVHKLGVLLGEEPTDKNGKPSASRQALRSYAADHKVIQLYLAWKKAEKRRQMVVALLDHQDADGFIRASYLQLGADTGRMSCREPNLQQVPRDKGFRQAAEAPEGWNFVVADFGQMELRLAAAESQDALMISAFQRDEDLHTITAQAIYPEPTEDEAELKARRQVAKSANFGLLYGSGAKGLRDYAGAMGITMSVEEAEKIRETFHNTYQGIHDWQRQNANLAKMTEHERFAEIRIPKTGMRRFLIGDMNRLTTRCNTPIQGAGAAILKYALANLWPLLHKTGSSQVRLAAVVHDEIVLLVREGLEEEWATRLSQTMEEAESKWLGEIPALAEAAWGKTWSEAK